MKLTMYQIDAFAEWVFEGNPAAICPLQAWLPDATLQAIAAENNLSETAYFVPEADGYRLRWFTPAVEVDLCGHATLASAFVLYEHLGYAEPEIRFQTRSGVLTAAKSANGFSVIFPASTPIVCATPPALTAALGRAPRQTLATSNYVAVYDSEDEIRALRPDFAKFHELDFHGVVVTAPGREVDFVSRYFAPKVGINEDPVTGSTHCQLTPYWATQLGRTTLKAKQLSARGGSLTCTLQGEQVVLIGNAVHYMTAEIFIP